MPRSLFLAQLFFQLTIWGAAAVGGGVGWLALTVDAPGRCSAVRSSLVGALLKPGCFTVDPFLVCNAYAGSGCLCHWEPLTQSHANFFLLLHQQPSFAQCTVWRFTCILQMP